MERNNSNKDGTKNVTNGADDVPNEAQKSDDSDVEFSVSGIYYDPNRNKLMYGGNGDQPAFDCCDYIKVIKVVKNLDTQNVRVTFLHSAEYCKNEIEGNMSDLQRNRLYHFLTSKGVVVQEIAIKSLAHYLTEEVDRFITDKKVEYIHERVGWNKTSDLNQGYFSSKSIHAPYCSTLKGNESKFLGPNGNRSVYDAMVQSEVIRNKSLHLPFVLAFTAPLVPLMYEKTACPVLITNFAGKSSQGKSTSLVLIASVWGRGIISNSRLGVVKTFASTQNGYEATVNNNNGLPIMFDDYESASRSTSFGSLIYTLAQGESKIRCDKYGRPLETSSWRTYIGLTGESSIFERAGNNLGLRPRIVEFKNKQWTVSKQNSLNITSTINKNYGFYGEEFVDKLTKLQMSELEAIYDESDAEISKLLPPKDNISDRIQTRLALIRMTAVLVRKLMDLDIDINYITNFLVDNEINRQVSLDVFELAKERLIAFVNKNLAYFVRNDEYTETSLTPNSHIVGRIYNGNKGNFVAILPDSFKKIMDEFNDREAILEKWRDEKFLICDTDGRFQKKVSITTYAQAPRCYVFLYKDVVDLEKALRAEESVNVRGLEEDDLINRGKKSTGAVFYKEGKRYVAVPEEPKKIRTVLKKGVSHRDHGVRSPKSDSSVNSSKSVINLEAPKSTINFDDADAIYDIFNDESEAK